MEDIKRMVEELNKKNRKLNSKLNEVKKISEEITLILAKLEWDIAPETTPELDVPVPPTYAVKDIIEINHQGTLHNRWHWISQKGRYIG